MPGPCRLNQRLKKGAPRFGVLFGSAQYSRVQKTHQSAAYGSLGGHRWPQVSRSLLASCPDSDFCRCGRRLFAGKGPCSLVLWWNSWRGHRGQPRESGDVGHPDTARQAAPCRRDQVPGLVSLNFDAVDRAQARGMGATWCDCSIGAFSSRGSRMRRIASDGAREFSVVLPKMRR